MGDYENSKEEAMKVLRSINSLEDLKKKKDLMIDTQERFMNSAVDTLKDFFENLPNYSPEEKQAQVERFSDEKFIFDDEFNGHMDRIYNLPDCAEYMDSIDPEVQERLEPPMNEYLTLMQTKMMELMNELMGVVAPVMDAMAQGIGAAAGEMQKMAEEIMEEEEFYEPPREVEELVYSLPYYLRLRTLEELREEKEGMFCDIDELFKERIEEMNIIYEMHDDKGYIGTELKKLMKTRTLTKEEVGKFFDRIEERSGEKQYLDTLREEFDELMAPVEKQIRDLKYRFTQK